MNCCLIYILNFSSIQWGGGGDSLGMLFTGCIDKNSTISYKKKKKKERKENQIVFARPILLLTNTSLLSVKKLLQTF